MSTANGAAILDGCTFPQFLERMGAHLLHDHGPESSSTQEWSAKRQREFKELTRMPVGQALPLYQGKAEEFYQEQLKFDRQIRTARTERLAKYRAMETQTRSWKAPRPLADLKQSLLAEIRSNIRHDCPPVGSRPRRMSGHEFLAFVHEQLGRAARRSAEDAREAGRRQKRASVRANILRQELNRLKQ